MKIGLLGGSFNPIHNGHLHMAKCAYQYAKLDEVWLMPTGQSPHKDDNQMTDAVHRYAMCACAAQSFDWLKASDFELKSQEKNYTYRTLEQLKECNPVHEFFFIMGGDSLDYFDKWVNPKRICELAHILVIPRDEYDFTVMKNKAKHCNIMYDADIKVIPCANLPISSTEIRNRFSQGYVRYTDFPLSVFDYIKEHGLYGWHESV